MKNKEFIQWLIGFVDAEGNFYTNKNFDTQTFSIHLSLRDKKNLYKLEKLLEFGKVYEDLKNNRVLYTISKKEVLYKQLIPFFETYPLLTRKFYQYSFFKEILEKRINKDKLDEKIIVFKKTSKEDLNVKEILNKPYFDNWLIGFIEGEGSFMVIKDNNKFRPKFSICQKYDKIILEAIKERLSIKSKVFEEKENFYRLTIKSKKELKNLIGFIELSNIKFQGYKGEQYKEWCNKISNLENYKICLEI